MKKTFRPVLLALSLLGLLGCGLKGPLYFPDGQASDTSNTQQNTQQKPSMRP